jgi:putative flippase GtrA
MYNKLKTLYQKHREVASYIIVGGCTTLISLISRIAVIYFFDGDTLLRETILPVGVSWICAVTFAFFTNKIFVFQSVSETKADWLKQAGKFYGSRLTTLGLDLGFTHLLGAVLDINAYVVTFAVQVPIFIGNYFISKFLVFKNKK